MCGMYSMCHPSHHMTLSEQKNFYLERQVNSRKIKTHLKHNNRNIFTITTRGGLPCPFLNQKRCPDFGKICPDCVHVWITLFIYNVVSRICREKKFFPLRSLLCVVDEMLLKKTTPPWKVSGCTPPTVVSTNKKN